jgi:hypothetical protein
MTAQAWLLYAKNKNILKLSDLASANLRMVLLTSTYTPDITVTGHSIYANLTNELATAFGYTAGGGALTGVVAATAGNDGYKLSSENAVWTAASGSIPAFRYAVIYYLGSLWGLTNPLIAYQLSDNTPADIPATTTGNTLTITCPATGWFDIV